MSNLYNQLLQQNPSNETSRVKNIVNQYVFCEFATVTSWKDGFIECTSTSGVKYANVEVLNQGNQKVSIQWELASGDVVLLLNPRKTVFTVNGEYKSAESEVCYTIAGLKALPFSIAADTERWLFNADGTVNYANPETTLLIDSKMSVTIDGDNASEFALTIKAPITLNVTGDVKATIDGALSCSASGDTEISSDGNVTVTGSKVSVNGGNLEVS